MVRQVPTNDGDCKLPADEEQDDDGVDPDCGLGAALDSIEADRWHGLECQHMSASTE